MPIERRISRRSGLTEPESTVGRERRSGDLLIGDLTLALMNRDVNWKKVELPGRTYASMRYVPKGRTAVNSCITCNVPWATTTCNRRRGAGALQGRPNASPHPMGAHRGAPLRWRCRGLWRCASGALQGRPYLTGNVPWATTTCNRRCGMVDDGAMHRRCLRRCDGATVRRCNAPSLPETHT